MAFGPELVRQASRELAAPIALTTIAVALATVPVLARGSIAGHELLQPLAVVLLGGVLTAALINLFLLPLLYLRLGPSPAPVAMGLGADELASAEVASPFIHYMKGVSMRDRTAWLRGVSGRDTPASGRSACYSLSVFCLLPVAVAHPRADLPTRSPLSWRPTANLRS